MLFTSPIWLIGLLPWLAVAALLLLSRRPRTDVPFLDLWRLNAPQESIRRSFSTPPIGVIFTLLATLLAIIAAAGPAVRRAGADTLIVIVDAGRSMSATPAGDAGPAGGRTRFVAAADRLAELLRQEDAGNLPIDLRVVPHPPGVHDDQRSRTTVQSFTSAVAAVGPSAVDTGGSLDRVVRQALTAPDARVVVITDQPIEESARAARIAPDAPPAENVGIAELAVRRTPSPQALVRIVRSGPATASGAVLVRITSAGQHVQPRADVGAGSTLDLFVPLPAVGGVVTVEIVDSAGGPIADAFAGDNRADVIAETDWPVIEPEVSVTELQRLIDVYTAGRPRGERSISVRLTTSSRALGDSSGIVLAALSAVASPTRITRAVSHPAIDGIDLSNLMLPAAGDRSLPPGDWQPLLFDDAGPLLAVRQPAGAMGEPGVRQAWSAIDPRGWAERVQYVLFWSSLFNWIGGVGDDAAPDRMAAWPLASLTPDWTPVALAPGGEGAVYWPGVYQRQGDGRRRAFGPAATIDPREQAPAVDQAGSVRRLLRQGERLTPLSPWMLLAAVALAGVAAALWRRSSRPIAIALPVPAVAPSPSEPGA